MSLSYLESYVKGTILFSAFTQSRQNALEEMFTSCGNGIDWAESASTGKMVAAHCETIKDGKHNGKLASYLTDAINEKQNTLLKNEDTPKLIQKILNYDGGISLSNTINAWIFDNIDSYCKANFEYDTIDLRPKSLPTSYMQGGTLLSSIPELHTVCPEHLLALDEMCVYMLKLMPCRHLEPGSEEALNEIKRLWPGYLGLYNDLISFKNNYNKFQIETEYNTK